MELEIRSLLDDAKCYEKVRELRWKTGVVCPSCGSNSIVKSGKSTHCLHRQRYYCKDCKHKFDDLSGTLFEKRHQSLKTWITCLYLMGLNLSNRQIAQELSLSESDVFEMTDRLRDGILENQEEVTLNGEIECDEVYVVAGHKGQPLKVAEKNRKGRRNRLRGARGRGTLSKEKPPIFGMIQRGGTVILRMCENVRKVTITPLIERSVAQGSLIHTDEYNIYDGLDEQGYEHKTVCHSHGEYARDEDGDGFHEVHVNTMEGCWSLLRSWLRPHRGISQEKLPKYLGLFEFVYNAKKRGKALLHSLVDCLVCQKV